jgi:hypothetical protein
MVLQNFKLSNRVVGAAANANRNKKQPRKHEILKARKNKYRVFEFSCFRGKKIQCL